MKSLRSLRALPALVLAGTLIPLLVSAASLPTAWQIVDRPANAARANKSDCRVAVSAQRTPLTAEPSIQTLQPS